MLLTLLKGLIILSRHEKNAEGQAACQTERGCDNRKGVFVANLADRTSNTKGSMFAPKMEDGNGNMYVCLPPTGRMFTASQKRLRVRRHHWRIIEFIES